MFCCALRIESIMSQANTSEQQLQMLQWIDEVTDTNKKLLALLLKETQKSRSISLQEYTAELQREGIIDIHAGARYPSEVLTCIKLSHIIKLLHIF